MTQFFTFKAHGGGWTIVQKRQSATMDFNRGWADYKDGFGDPSDSYWIGLEKIYQMTKDRNDVMVRFNAYTYDGDHGYMIFKGFKIGPESDKYRLTTG